MIKILGLSALILSATLILLAVILNKNSTPTDSPTFTSSEFNISFRYPRHFEIEEKIDKAYGSKIIIKSPDSQMTISPRKKIVGYEGDNDNSTVVTDIVSNGKPVVLFGKPISRQRFSQPNGVTYFVLIETPNSYQFNLGVSYSFTQVTPENDFLEYDLLLSTITLTK